MWASGTWAWMFSTPGLESMPVISALRALRLPSTSPRNSWGTRMSTRMIGSRSTGPAFRQAASKPRAAAASKASGVEVDWLYSAPLRVTPTSMTG